MLIRKSDATSREETVLRKPLIAILGSALMALCGTAHAFTLIELPTIGSSPGTSVPDATTITAQVTPIVGVIRAQLLAPRRGGNAGRVALADRLLASNEYGLVVSDASLLAAAVGAPATGGANTTHSLWVSGTHNALKNDFYRTQFYGDTHNVLAGYDLTRSDRYVVGVSFGYEASNFTNEYAVGSQRTRGFNVAPYFAYLLSDAWSVDFAMGYGEFDTRQSRSLAVVSTLIPIPSEFSSTREFASVNLTGVGRAGGWTMTGSLGTTAAKRKQDAYDETLLSTSYPETEQSVKQWNLLGELAYGRGASEAFFSANYEKTRNPPTISFPTGDQPANDPDGWLLTAGWRHFGKGFTANVAFSSRQGQEQVGEYGFAMTLRFDL